MAAFYSGLQLCLTSWDIYFNTIFSPPCREMPAGTQMLGQASPGAKHMSVGGTLVILVQGRC